MFYIYVHMRKDNGLPFYIGKGVLGRPYSRHGRTKEWANVASEAGFQVHILAEIEDERSAIEFESNAIKQYRDLGVQLVNKLESGWVCGRKLSSKTNDAVRMVLSGASVRDAARRVGISTSSVYLKLSLLGALIPRCSHCGQRLLNANHQS